MFYHRSFRKNGKLRKLTIPTDELRKVHAVLIPYLNEVPLHDAAHGFVAERSPLTNATVHFGARYIMNMDVKDFFPSISPMMFLDKAPIGFRSLPSWIKDWTIGSCFYEDSLPQGSSCSPVLSNIFMVGFDEKLTALLAPLEIKYTRFADDITLSGNYDALCGERKVWMDDFLSLMDERGLILNKKKTLIRPFHQRQEITGVCINNGSSGLSRKKREEFFLAVRGRSLGDFSASELGFLSYARSIDERYYRKICAHLI